MAAPYSRTLRSLEAENQRFAWLGIFLFIPLLLVWGIWFVTANVGVHEVSLTAETASFGMVRAIFPETAVNTIAIGQPATIQFPSPYSSGATLTVDAVVFDTDRQPQNSQFGVEMAIIDEDLLPALSPDSQPNQVEILTAEKTPAEFAWEALAERLDAAVVVPLDEVAPPDRRGP
ncbi:MAG: hypothetical protein AAF614_36545 [Chloroflexota bacterium]